MTHPTRPLGRTRRRPGVGSLVVVRTIVLAWAVLGHSAPAAAQASAFFRDDARNAGQVASILAGSPYDMAAAEWRTGSNINRESFAFKVVSALFMLGYQTEMSALVSGGSDQHLRALHHFQSRNGLLVSDVVDAATLGAIDAQVAQREPLLAQLAHAFPLYDHMQPLHPNDVSTDTVAAIYALPMSILPASLRLSAFELIQCISGQCVGGIQDAAGADMFAWFYEARFIDPDTSGYRFVGAYFDRARANGRLPSAVVDVDTVLHEFAHYVDGTYGGPFGSFPGNPQVPHWNVLDTTGFYAIHYDLSTRTNSGCVTPRSQDVSDWISLYGYTPASACAPGQRQPAEDFAEAFTFYVMSGVDFRAAAARRPMLAQQYAWLKAHVFDGVEFDTHLPQGTHSGCNDVPGAAGRLPGHVTCDDAFVWDFTIPHGLVAGTCGAAQGASFWTAPTERLCEAGAPSVVDGPGPWSWTCRGLNGGTDATCTANAARVPDSPTAVTATSGDGLASIAFSAPAHDGGRPVTAYLVTASPGLASWSGTASPITATGLTNGTIYRFTVTALNANGAGQPSAASNAVQPLGPPAAPTIGTATAGNRQATVHFGPPPFTGGSAITSYTVTSNPAGSSASGAVSPITVTGLTAGTTYSFTVSATSALGTGPASAPSNSVVPPLLLLATDGADTADPPALPSGWQSIVQIQTTGLWRTSAGGNVPASIAPHSDSHLFYFNAHAAGVNQSARLVSPAFSLAGVTGARVSAWIFRDGDAATFMVGDYVEVYVSATTSIAGATKLGTVNRSRWLSPAVATAGWYQYVFDIPATFTATTTHVIVLGYSQGGGNDIHVDDITVATVPGAPVIGAADALDGSVRMGFSTGDDGGAPVALLTATCSPAGGGAARTATGPASPLVVTGLVNGTTYTCSVTASNAVGTSAPSGTVSATPLSSEATLASLVVSNGTLSPVFAVAHTAYTAIVDTDVVSVTLRATPGDPAATIRIAGMVVANNAPSQAFVPTVGAGVVVDVVITAQDGRATTTYRVTLQRAPSTNARLGHLGVTAGTLRPAFTPDTLDYSMSVVHDTTAIALVAAVADASAAIAVNGAPTSSGAVSPPIVLDVGHTLVTVTVMAQDATTTRSYTVDVERAALPPPVIDTVMPAQGPATGGTPVTVTGAWFVQGATTVAIGGVPATDVVVIDRGTLQLRTPASPVGPRDIVIETAAGTTTAVGGFTYQAVWRLGVTMSGTGSGTVTSVPAGITCGLTCSIDVNTGTSVTLNAEPAEGSVFAGWSAPCTGTSTCTVTVEQAISVNAEFGRPTFTRYLAEGATSAFLDTRIALLNHGATDAATTLILARAGDTAVMHDTVVPAHARVTFDPKTLAGFAAAEFSTTVVSDAPLVVDRTMSWDASGYGGHAETAVAAPSPVWYLAEGATHSGFDLFYLLLNPAAHDVPVRVRYLRPVGVPLEKTYVLAPGSRTNIWVNTETFADQGQALASTDVSAVIATLDDTPIIVERALYLSNQGRVFNAGHDSLGVTAPSTRWFFAEGATGSYFDLFVLVANPNDTAAVVNVTYLLTDGRTFTRSLTAPPASRTNIWVDAESFDGGTTFPLADVAVSTLLASSNGVPIIAERSLWWPGGFDNWHEAHNSAGATQAGTLWALAEGAVGGSRAEETYLLIANTSAHDGQAIVTLYLEDGRVAQKTFALRAQARANVAIAQEFGPAVQDARFGAVVESVGETPAQIVVERAMYWNAGGVTWAAGTNALATRLR